MAPKSKRQGGALPVRRRRDGSIEVLIVTSRETGRWIADIAQPRSRLERRVG
jgi:hypothetical protein